jgi:cbb3-type cytochrome oxidase subunit 3
MLDSLTKGGMTLLASPLTIAFTAAGAFWMTSIGIILLFLFSYCIIWIGISYYKRRQVASHLEARTNLLNLGGLICFWLWCFFVILFVHQSSSDMILIIGFIVLCVGVGLQIFSVILRNRIRNQQK